MVILGLKAGLGNQLFQYAAARQLALEMNTDLYLDLSFYSACNERNERLFRLDLFNIDYLLAKEEDIRILKNRRNPGFIYRFSNKIGISSSYYKKSHWSDEELSMYYRGAKSSKSVYLSGWFSKPQYFRKISTQIISEFTPRQLSTGAKYWLDSINATNSVAVHIRRGDYLTIDYFNKLPLSYYNSAIDYVKGRIKDPVFYFFSDDPNFLSKEFGNKPEFRLVNTSEIDGNSVNKQRDVEDLFLISACKNQIIANSTFSWWGAWLNRNIEKIVVAPHKWFNDRKAQSRYENGQLIPYNWIKLK